MIGKLVAALISPLGTALCLLLLGLVLWQWAARPFALRWARRLVVLAFAWIWLWSTPWLSDALCGWIEAQAGPRTVAELPNARVAVVLGGGMSGPRAPLRPYADLNASADRVWHAARLFHAGKAEKLLLSGGVVRTGDDSEAASMAAFLRDLGVPPSALLLEALSENTAGNAQLTATRLLSEGVTEILLVTSALHMPRARLQFERAGLRVLPAPTDFEVIEMPFDVLRLVPQASALQASGQAFKELFGRWVA